MREDVLQYLWQHKISSIKALKTTRGALIHILNIGLLNTDSGPDFFNAQLKIDHQLWVGTVEVHQKSSDWYVYNHENDLNYNNVILHVVWEHDVEVFRHDNTIIPVLELKHYITKGWLKTYTELYLAPKQFINCESRFAKGDDFLWNSWMERLYVERLEVKHKFIVSLLQSNHNDWEAVLFLMLARAFGLKVNADAFFSMAKSFTFSLVNKLKGKPLDLEALFLGQSQLLSQNPDCSYESDLLERYAFIKRKYHLKSAPFRPQFFRLRPNNFPTLRLSQLAQFYAAKRHVFSTVSSASSVSELYDFFNVKTSAYWETHYTFTKVSSKKVKPISKKFIQLLIINAIAPVIFSYKKHIGENSKHSIMDLMRALPAEKNSTVSHFNALKVVVDSALASQAILQLKTNYCDTNTCVKCLAGQLFLK